MFKWPHSRLQQIEMWLTKDLLTPAARDGEALRALCPVKREVDVRMEPSFVSIG